MHTYTLEKWHFPKPASYYGKLLRGLVELSHVTIEVHRCEGEPCVLPDDGSSSEK